MTINQWTVLRLLALNGDWCEPRELGGTQGSFHSKTLKSLVMRGFVEAQDKRPPDAQTPRYEYRVTSAGLDRLHGPAPVSSAKGTP